MIEEMKEGMKNKIKDIVLELGADVCGIANVSGFFTAPTGFHPTDIYKACKSVVVFGYALPKGLASVEPDLIYGHFNADSSHELDRIALSTAKQIEFIYKTYAIPLPSDNPYQYWIEKKKEGRGLLSIKHAAVAAGLGTLGKNTLVLNEKFGNMMNYGAILTGLDLPSDPPAKTICIESCQICLNTCPAQAITKETVDQQKCRTHTYGKNERGFDVVKCNRCRTACPLRFGLEKSYARPLA